MSQNIVDCMTKLSSSTVDSDNINSIKIMDDKNSNTAFEFGLDAMDLIGAGDSRHSDRHDRDYRRSSHDWTQLSRRSDNNNGNGSNGDGVDLSSISAKTLSTMIAISNQGLVYIATITQRDGKPIYSLLSTALFFVCEVEINNEMIDKNVKCKNNNGCNNYHQLLQ